MTKEHSVYTLIHTLDTKEKSFFKKSSFTLENESNRILKLIFDILNKQKDYSLESLLKHKKINDTTRKNIHVWLNSLQKKIISTLVIMNKNDSEESRFYFGLEEYDVLMKKKLYEQANKKIKKIEQFGIENNLHFLLPLLYKKINEHLINNVSIKKEYKKEQIIKYQKSIQAFNHYSSIQIIASNFENLIEENGSIFFTDDEKLNRLQSIKNEYQKLIPYFKNTFKPTVAINSNLLTINLMLSNEKDIKNSSLQFIDFYLKNKSTLTTKEKSITFISFNNIANFNLIIGNNDIFKSIMSEIEDCIEIDENQTLRQELITFQTNLWSLYYFINPDLTPPIKHIDYCIKRLKNYLKKDRAYYELLTTTSIVLLNIKRYDESLDLTNEISTSDFSERINDSYVFIKLTRAICWLKLENIELFDSELNSVYKFILKNQTLPYSKDLTNFIKKIILNKAKKNKIRELEILYNKYKIVSQKGTFYEKMQVIELRLLLEISLK